MTRNLDQEGLSAVAQNYSLFYIDLWGVIHNGIFLHKEAIKTLNELDKQNKEYVLLTNAPRPNSTVKVFLEKMGLDEKIREHVFTSGEAALIYLKKNFFSQKFYHIGPPRDFDLFKDFKKMKSEDLNKSDYFLCTGLFEKQDTDLNYYRELFEKKIDKKMICTNPDLMLIKETKENYVRVQLPWFLKKWVVRLYTLENHTPRFIIFQLIIKIRKLFV